ncbi:unnamed protein product [Owenia fusiformis]|uniref:Large ribosomal subunit protein mL43 n=1 Tax=Owenia fusiformis TaxID=6347 RepID=A0A8J1T8T4_OWEFU|nr:unnamed protein product [Owenia fusiformis]
MASRAIPSDFVKSVLQNGVGRHICQLQRLTLKFCKESGTSRGVRDFIENHLIDFTRSNPGIVVYLKPRRHRTPYLVGEYLNTESVYLNVHKNDQEEVCKWVEHLRTRSGEPIVRLRKKWFTNNPSIQGIWTPFTNKDTRWNIAQFPELVEDEHKAAEYESSATEDILEMFRQMKNVEVIEEGTLEKDVPK